MFEIASESECEAVRKYLNFIYRNVTSDTAKDYYSERLIYFTAINYLQMGWSAILVMKDLKD